MQKEEDKIQKMNVIYVCLNISVYIYTKGITNFNVSIKAKFSYSILIFKSFQRRLRYDMHYNKIIFLEFCRN